MVRERAKVTIMRTLAFVSLIAIVLAWPLSARCQQSWQLHDPNEYTQEDSHPVRVIGWLLSPVGFALEWGIARPLHYVATQTPLAPVLNGGEQEDSWGEYYDSQGPIMEAPVAPPPAAQPNSSGQQAFREQDLGYRAPAPLVSRSTRSYQTTPSAAQQAPPPASQGQSVLH